jgi:DNA-binding beta-propeller fold protein YncE
VQPVPERPAPSPAPAQTAPPPPPPPAAQTTPPATAPAAKATDEAVIDAPAIPYRSVPNFLKLPRDMHMGEASGVATNSEGHIFVFVRGGSSIGPAYGNTASQLWEFDRNGHFLREIGKNLYAWAFAHTVRVDKDDNIWATDKGSDMVVKFNPQGQVEMVFGRKSEAADEGAHPWPHPKPPAPAVDGRFRQPTDVTWDNSGNIYVSDGYINARIAKYDKAGNWVKSWGTHGKGPGQFDLVHAIASDADGNIYVADRNNRRIQVFDGDGNLKRIIHVNVAFPDSAQPAIGNKPNLKDYLKSGGSQTPGAPWTLCITPPPHQVLYTSDSFPGRIYKLSLDGKVLGVLGQSGKQLGQFGWVHEIACPSENTLYVAEILNWRVQKLLLNNASDTSGDTAAPSDRRERRMERREERREQRRRNRYRE